MSESESDSGVSGAAGGETVCPACDSTNTDHIAARGLQYQCRDCNNKFNPSTESMNTDRR